MRIAYVGLHWARTKESGVGKKIQSQLAMWRALGHEARMFMHASTGEPAERLIEADVYPYEARGKFVTEINRIRAARRMVDAVAAFKPDIVYLRYGIYVYPVQRLMRIAPVVEEINTNDLTQHEDLGGLYSLYNRLTRGIFLRLVRGLVAVSRELEVSPAFVFYRKPTRVIANGIELDSFTPLSAPSNQTPRLAFIGSPGYLWHGVDKLVDFARRFSDVQLDIVGYDSLPEFEPLPPNLTLNGYLSSQDYLKVLARADAAISSLALHRIQLNEASTLKSRECLALGLPLVVAYKDTDLDDLDCDFLLKIPNKEDNIHTHGEAIRDFAYRMRGVRADRVALKDRIDSTRKEELRLKFFEEIVRETNAQHP
ncbi:MAG: glycosyltransferase [Anaerolineales bacterium]|nr:glycosyltransferase [Anaerolineales bacterium]